jgi:nucleoside-diphosphate-sugar epimerase
MKGMKQRVLVVGANGLVGRDFKEAFAEKYTLTEFTKGSALADLPSAVDTIVFTAQSGDYKQPEFTQNLFEVNVKLVHEILSYYSGKATKVIYFSSGSVYKNEGKTLTEASPLNTLSGNPYVTSKLMAEELVSSFQNAFDTLITLRPFFIYGKHQNPQMLMKTMFEKVREEQSISLSGKKGLIFNPVYVEDVSILIDHLINIRDIIGYNTFNVAGPEITHLHEAVRIMGEIADHKLDISIQANNDSSLLAEVNIKGWKPVYGIKDGLTKTFGA